MVSAIVIHRQDQGLIALIAHYHVLAECLDAARGIPPNGLLEVTRQPLSGAAGPAPDTAMT